METVWDWVTVICFAVLVVMLLQRSSEPEPRDKLLDYFPPSVGCMLANYLGNEGWHVPAAVVLAAVIVYVVKVLKFSPDEFKKLLGNRDE